MRTFVLFVVAACGRIGFGAQSGELGGDGGLPPCTTTPCACNADTDCSAIHTYCSAHDGAHTCECVAGYGRAAPDATCAWVGVIVDPGFQDPTAWTTDGTIDPTVTAAGMVDPGEAKLTALERASQTITMPRRAAAEPLVAQMSYKGAPFGANRTRPTAGINNKWLTFGSNTTFGTVRTCLGAGQYAPATSSGFGTAMPFEVMPVAALLELDIDRVEIVPAMAGECTTPGPIVAGDCETDGAWAFTVSTSTGMADGSTAGFVAGAGENGSRAVQLHNAFPCDGTRAALTFSILSIEEQPTPAFRFWFSAASGVYVSEQSPGNVNLYGTGSPTVYESCVTPDLIGMDATFSVLQTSSGTCSTPLDWTTSIDSLEIVNEPACAGSAALVDPGFESGLRPIASQVPLTATITVLDDVTLAHSGTHVLELSASNTCDALSVDIPVFPLASSAAGGPALAFYYRSPAGTNWTPIAAPTAGTFIRDDAWHSAVMCFNPQLAGRPQNAAFLFQYNGGACGMTVAEEHVLLDDLALTNDPSCPQ